jgi:uncharacterized membrane protein
VPVLIVLLVSWLVFRAVGAAGLYALASWQDSARYALVVMFVFTATAHFNKMKHDLVRMIPPYFPRPLLIVYITGAFELLGAAGLMVLQSRRLAGICLIALLVGMFIANVNAAHHGVTLRAKPPTPLWLRAPMQVFSSRFSGGQLAPEFSPGSLRDYTAPLITEFGGRMAEASAPMSGNGHTVEALPIEKGSRY